jgi:hypothetical protein
MTYSSPMRPGNPPLPPFRKPKVTLWSGGMGGIETYFLCGKG